MAQEKSRKDIYQTITDQIVGMLEQGVKPWTQLWEGAQLAMPLRFNGEGYRGINILSLWASATMQGFTKPHWMTFKQALALGGCVRKGEKGTSVVYANSVSVTDENAAGDDERKSMAFLKLYTVFNACQIDGIDATYPEPAIGPENPDTRAAWLDSWFGALGIEIRHGGPSAHYTPSLDTVQMPNFEQFHSSDDYYSTLAHECVHASGHKARLDRDTLHKADISNRAREELCAELGSAFVCGGLGIKLHDREDHAAYLVSWLRALKNDKRAIFHAASAAQRASDYLFSLAGDAQSGADSA